MIYIRGEYTDAVVYTDNIDECVYNQINELCNHFAFRNSVIRIMPDCHAGKGCVIGFTAVLNEKKIIPDIVGVDIGCGVMATVFRTDREIIFKSLDDFIRKNIPSGMNIRETASEYVNSYPDIICKVDEICKIVNANERKEAFLNSLGTLGGGNHFIEIDRISDNTYLLAVHTGSRSLGLNVCKYFQRQGSVVDEELKRSINERHRSAMTVEEHIAIQNEINDMQTVRNDLAYISGEMYDKYILCMKNVMEYAHINRTLISDEIMNYLISNEDAVIMERFDTVHNYIDSYSDGSNRIIIRKGAISAERGQRLCVPLNMRDGIVVGRGKGNTEWNNSAPHGSGRALSRSQARQNIMLDEYISSMSDIFTWSVSEATIDESPMAYKPSDEIIHYLEDTVDIDFIAKTLYNFKAD